MPRFIVTEIVKYSVEARTAGDAVDLITESEDRDRYCHSVADRYAEDAAELDPHVYDADAQTGRGDR